MYLEESLFFKRGSTQMLKFSIKKKFNDCPCTGANLEKLIHPAILTLLVTEEELHGYIIVQKLQGTCMLQGKKPDPSGVYRCLKQLEHNGHVTAIWDVSNPGLAKKLYRITDDGLECLKTWINTLGDYHHSLGMFLSFAINAVKSKGNCCE
jgi:PadR family transcriptional regulator PadR